MKRISANGETVLRETAPLKRVVFLADICTRGGASVWLRRLCRHLPQAGWSCKLIMGEPPRPYDDDWSQWPCAVEILRRYYSWPAFVRGVASRIEAFQPDVVVSGTPWKPTVLAMRYLYGSGSFAGRFVDTIIADYIWEYERLRSNTDIIAAVAAASESSASRTEAELPVLRGKVRRFWFPIPYPAEVPVDRNTEGPLRVAYLGRLAREKRVLDLAPMVASLAERGVDFTLTVIGDGPERVSLERQLAACGLSERVRLLGWLPNEAAIEAVAACHVQLLVSEYEGQPISMMEAMACGVVPIVTNLPGTRELIQSGVNGFLLPVGDTEAFVSALSEMAADRQRLRRMGQVARETVPEKARLDIAISDFAAFLKETSGAPLPTPKPVEYPRSKMDRFGVPNSLQGLKRWLFGPQIG